MNNALISRFNDDEFVRDNLPLFINSQKSRVSKIRNLLDSNEVDTMVKVLHQIKGSAASYGFPLLVDKVEKLQATVLEKGCHLLREDVDDLDHVISRIESGISLSGS